MKLQIFERIRAAGSASRSQIAKELRISPATASTLTAELIDDGFLCETRATLTPTDSPRGRPPVALAIEAGRHLVAGIKLGTHEMTGIVVNFGGQQIASARIEVDTGMDSPRVWAENCATLFRELLNEGNLTPPQIAHLGVAVPGYVDNFSGIVAWSPLLDTRGTNFADLLHAHLGVPVSIDNDANLVALAELWFGVGRDKSDFLVVTVEKGVGTGAVLDHRLFRGAHGYGLELAHTKVQLDGALCRCGQRGCLEAYVSDYALVREARAALGLLDEPVARTTELLIRLGDEAKAGNPVARSIFTRAGRYLALGLANMVSLLDPSFIILSGDRLGQNYFEAEESLSEMRQLVLGAGRSLPRIEVHRWDDLLWAHGGAALALSAVTEAELGLPREDAA
ncbi:ROK family transcriptional regulator [Palleronia caenipelagi]|uniref:ROK family transcriptional regulator n=1 Tax=Palleronia caenipelagi TaxID=2489174 RepID=UPI001FE6EF88|nr:ROK family protein [Palleronia caenipelagi]